MIKWQSHTKSGRHRSKLKINNSWLQTKVDKKFEFVVIFQNIDQHYFNLVTNYYLLFVLLFINKFIY